MKLFLDDMRKKGVRLTLFIIILLAIAIGFILGTNYKNFPIIISPTTECHTDNDCSWCGTDCIKYRPGLACPDIMPVDSVCECIGNRCQAVFVGTTTISARYVDLNYLAKNPDLYVGSYIKVRGHVVKNVGAFFGDTYHLQSDEWLRDFKSLSESSTGMAIISSESDLEDFVEYTFDGKNYTHIPKNFFYVEAFGFVKDRGNVMDAARYVLEIDNIYPQLAE